jgi:hypothetical protein
MRFCLIAATFLAAGSSAYMIPVRREYPVSGGGGVDPASSESTPCEQGQSTSDNSPVTGVPSASVSLPPDVPPVVTESGSGYTDPTETETDSPDSGYPAPTETDTDSPDSGYPAPTDTGSNSGYPAPTETDTDSPDSGYPAPTETDTDSPDSGYPAPTDTGSNSGYPAPTETETDSPNSGYPGPTGTESDSGYPTPTETEPDSGSVSIPIFSTSATDAAGGDSGTYPTMAPPERF